MMKDLIIKIILCCILFPVVSQAACPSFPEGIYDEDSRMLDMRKRGGAPIPVITVAGGETCLSTGGLGPDLKNGGVTSDSGVTCFGGSYKFPMECVALRASDKVYEALIISKEKFENTNGMDSATAELFQEGYRSMAHYLMIEEGQLASRFYSCKSLDNCHTCQPDPTGQQACANRVARTIGVQSGGQSPFFFWRARLSGVVIDQ